MTPFQLYWVADKICNHRLCAYLGHRELIHSTSTLSAGHIQYEASNKVVLNTGFTTNGSAKFTAYMGAGGSPQWMWEWDVRDHLGNLRLVYDDSKQVVQRADYYPFGLKKTASTNSTHDNLYGYNGIEEVNDFGLDVNMATFRTLDPALGRWWQVDPKAESLMRLSPYNSMVNSPMMNADPEGDLPFIAIPAIGAAVGVFSNGLSNANNGQGFFKGAGSVALWSAVSATVSFGIGNGIGAAGGIGKELFRAGVHAYAGGIISGIQGGSFGQGALSGGLSSLASSGVSALGGGPGIGTLSGGISGGIGSVISGGNFFEGFGQGVAVSAFNHVIHQAAEKINLRTEKKLIKKLMCACLEEFANSEAPNLKNIIEGWSRDWSGYSFKTKAKLAGHKYDIYVDGDFTDMLRVGFTANLQKKLLGRPHPGQGGFYVLGQSGKGIVTIRAKSGSPAYTYLKDLFILNDNLIK